MPRTLNGQRQRQSSSEISPSPPQPMGVGDMLLYAHVIREQGLHDNQSIVHIHKSVSEWPGLKLVRHANNCPRQASMFSG